uniref:Neur_chan_LBD domain-containing protein n=1 Tax=Heterorhabditis bacteriophora TaxID=37862 RepID=A0A1I7WH83_HETBA
MVSAPLYENQTINLYSIHFSFKCEAEWNPHFKCDVISFAFTGKIQFHEYHYWSYMFFSKCSSIIHISYFKDAKSQIPGIDLNAKCRLKEKTGLKE